MARAASASRRERFLLQSTVVRHGSLPLTVIECHSWVYAREPSLPVESSVHLRFSSHSIGQTLEPGGFVKLGTRGMVPTSPGRFVFREAADRAPRRAVAGGSEVWGWRSWWFRGIQGVGFAGARVSQAEDGRGRGRGFGRVGARRLRGGWPSARGHVDALGLLWRSDSRREPLCVVTWPGPRPKSIRESR